MPVAPVTGIGCNCTTVPGAAVPRPRYEPALANQPLTFAIGYDDTAPASTFPVALQARARHKSAPERRRNDLDRRRRPARAERQLQRLHSRDRHQTALPICGSVTGPTARRPIPAWHSPRLTAPATARPAMWAAIRWPMCCSTSPRITGVRNPLAAAGGVDPETPQHIQQSRRSAFRPSCAASRPTTTPPWRRRFRASSRRKGTMRWTGSWYYGVCLRRTGHDLDVRRFRNPSSKASTCCA